MAADKLVLLSGKIRPRFEEWALDAGKARGGYLKVLSLGGPLDRLPIVLHYRGVHNGIHKLDFIGVAKLGLSRATEIAEEICGGDVTSTRVCRVDWALDLPNVRLEEIGLMCRIASVQNVSVIRSRSGSTFYPRRSRDHCVLFYDRLKRLRSLRDPAADLYGRGDHLTRFEVQLRGRAVPFRRFGELRRFANYDLLSNITFQKFGMRSGRLTPLRMLAAEALLARIAAHGVQLAAKMFSAPEWSYLLKALLEERRTNLPDLNELMRQSVCDWLNDRVRFARKQS